MNCYSVSLCNLQVTLATGSVINEQELFARSSAKLYYLCIVMDLAYLKMIILICLLNSQALMIDLVILPYMHSVSLCEMKRYFSPKKDTICIHICIFELA